MSVEPEPELVAGRYRLGPVIGRGGMGEVRRARDLRLNRDVAIKFLRADLATEPEVRRRFEDEATSAAQLSHPNVVTVFDTGDHAGEPYIVMEGLAGRTLADELVDGPLTESRVRGIASEILSALAAAHQIGIVHRDVKPATILIADDGSAKVADFGIAKSMENLDHTVAGQIIGTPAYLAPERLEGQRATPQSDMYSLGVVLYEALAGQQPYSGDTPLVLAHAVLSKEPIPLRELRPDIDAGLAATVERAMHKTPERRFSDAPEMAASLTTPPAGPAGKDPSSTTERVAQGDLTRPLAVGSTQRLPPPPVTTDPGGGPPPPPRHDRSRLMAMVAIAVIMGMVLVGLAVRDRGPSGDEPDPSPAVPTTASPATEPLPQPLEDALDRLDEAVGR
ncbi:MAG TPA: serine/threonine-protein kinase [Acidimicrobiales bacterium]|nr:serine/threonine-protein kinase [Acidimicrobiales bacterium]